MSVLKKPNIWIASGLTYSLLGQNSCRQSGNKKLKIAVLSNGQQLSVTESYLTVYI